MTTFFLNAISFSLISFSLIFFNSMEFAFLSKWSSDFLLFLYNQHPVYLQRIPDKYIAEFMGISKEWLSKLKKKVLKNNK